MKRRTKAILAAVVMIGIAGMLFMKHANTDADLPTYQGKTVEEWFWGTNGNPGSGPTRAAARPAFAAMGTNCIPYLIKKATIRETLPNRLHCWVDLKLPDRLRGKLSTPVRASYVQAIAWNHLSELEYHKSIASMANEILKAISKTEDDWVRSQALQYFGHLVYGIEGKRKKTAFLLPFLNDPSFEIQVQAAVLLSKVDPSSTNGIPILLAAASDTNLLAQAIDALWPSSMSVAVRGRLTADLISSRRESVREALRRRSPKIQERADPEAIAAQSP